MESEHEHQIEQPLPPQKPVAIAPPPRVWTVFSAVFLALVLAVFFQTTFVVFLAVSEVRSGVKPNELGDVFKKLLVTPWIMMAMMATGQLGIGLAALTAIASRTPFWERVGVRRARPSWTVYPVTIVASIVPLAVGLAAAEAMALVIEPDESLVSFFDALTLDTAFVFVVFIGVVPGLFEEVLFRGVMQQRLIERWGVVTGIVVTSIIFGLFHMTPHAIAAATPLGFWLGFIAWRSRSIVPAIFCHFAINSGLNAWRVIAMFGELSETTQNVVHVCLLVVGLCCFAVVCWPGYWRRCDEQNATRDSQT